MLTYDVTAKLYTVIKSIYFDPIIDDDADYTPKELKAVLECYAGCLEETFEHKLSNEQKALPEEKRNEIIEQKLVDYLAKQKPTLREDLWDIVESFMTKVCRDCIVFREDTLTLYNSDSGDAILIHNLFGLIEIIEDFVLTKNPSDEMKKNIKDLLEIEPFFKFTTNDIRQYLNQLISLEMQTLSYVIAYIEKLEKATEKERTVNIINEATDGLVKIGNVDEKKLQQSRLFSHTQAQGKKEQSISQHVTATDQSIRKK